MKIDSDLSISQKLYIQGKNHGIIYWNGDNRKKTQICCKWGKSKVLFSFDHINIVMIVMLSCGRCSMSSVQFSHSVVSDSLRPHEWQHVRPPCPSATPRDYSNSCPSSRWCHPDISSSVVPFSSCPQSLPASGSFPKSQFFAWGGQSIGVSALIALWKL